MGDDIVESTAAQTIQASAIPDLVKRDADVADVAEVDPFEIRSSFADSLTDSVYPAKRSFYLTTYVSVTSTITSVFLVRSSTTKTLGDNFASSLKIVCFLQDGAFADDNIHALIYNYPFAYISTVVCCVSLNHIQPNLIYSREYTLIS